MGEDRGSVFSQPNWQVRGDVYNVAGNLLLSKNGTKEDFLVALRSIKSDLAKLEGLPEGDCRNLEEELDRTADEAVTAEPSRDRITERLSRVRSRLAGLASVASGALELAKTVGQIVSWAHGFPF